MKKLFLALACFLGLTAYAGEVVQTITAAALGVVSKESGNPSYKDFTDVVIDGVTMSANIADNPKDGQNEYGLFIQMRGSQSSGIVSTTTIGKLKKVVLTWHASAAGRTVQVYGKNEAYTAPSLLYENGTAGTLLGELNINNATEMVSTLAVPGDYAYVGIRSKSNALYLEKIEITWETAGEGGGEDPVTPPTPAGPGAAPQPTLPAAQVISIFSEGYASASNGFNFGEWGSGTTTEMVDLGAGDMAPKYVTTDLGYFGWEFLQHVNALGMEKVHFDIYPVTGDKVRIVPITGAPEVGVFANDLVANQWNSIDIALDEFPGANFADIYQIKWDNCGNSEFYLDNVYFYTTKANTDTEAPVMVSATMKSADYTTAVITVKGTDNSGAVTYNVTRLEGNAIIPCGSGGGESGQNVDINITGLAPNTTYTLSVVATDRAENASEAMTVTVTTKAAPAPAPAPTAAADDVVSILSDAYTPATTFAVGGWGQSTQTSYVPLAAGDEALFLSNFNYLGLELNSNQAIVPERMKEMQYLHIDAYGVEGAGSFSVTPIWGAEGVYNLDAPAQGAWTGYDVPLADFAGINLENIYQIKFMNGSGSLFLDNIYFYKKAETGGDDPVTPPTPEEGVTIVVADALSNPTATITNLESFTAENITVATTDNSGSSKPAFNVNGQDARYYANQAFAVSSSTNHIVKIVFNLSSKGIQRQTTLTPSTGKMEQTNGGETATWTGDANRVVFTLDAKADYGTDGKEAPGQFDFVSMVVTLGEEGGYVGGDEPVTPPTPGEGYDNLAAWVAGKPAADAAVNSAVTAVYQNGKDLYITDGDAWMLVYGKLDETYNNGDVIPAGITGKYDVYNGQPEFVPVASTFGAATAGTPVSAALIDAADVTAANLCKYVRLEGVTIELDAAVENGRQFICTDANGDEVILWNRWNYTVEVLEGEDMTVYGFVGILSKDGVDTIQIYPVLVEGEEDPDAPVTANAMFDFAKPEALNPAQTVSEGEAGAVSIDGVTFTSGPISLVTVKGTNTVGPRLWQNGTYDPHMRLYQGNLTTIAGNNVTITDIRFNMVYDAKGCVESIDEGGSLDEVSYGSKLVEWKGETSKIVFHWQKYTNESNGNQYSPYVQSIVVTYVDGAGIEGVTTIENTAVEYFNLQGVRITEPAAGQIVIRRQGNNVSKIIVR